MKRLFLDCDGRLRNGWWMLVFILGVVLTRALYPLLSRTVKALGGGEWALAPIGPLLLLLVTWICLRLRGQGLAAVGLSFGLRWWRQAGGGLLLGVGSLLACVGLIWAVGGMQFELDPSRSFAALLSGFYLLLCAAVLEELLFRGFLFQRLLDGSGVWFAQISLALVFSLGHWDNPGMSGAVKLIASIELGLASILLGLAYLRTRSLALPIGLHLGWNWAQGHVFGLGVSGIDHAGWWRPLLLEQPVWLNGGAFGAEASLFAPLVDLTLILLLWRWKGRPEPEQARPQPALKPALASAQAG